MHEKRHFLSYWKCRYDAQITWPYAYYVTLGSRCKMANLSSEDETDTLPKRPTRIQPYQFEPVRQYFERVPEHRVSFEANPTAVFHGLCEIAITEVLATQMGVMRRSKKVSSFELYKFNPLSPPLRVDCAGARALPLYLGSSGNCYSSRQHSRPA